ncbi:MAG: tetratricopeptide repeat protein [Chloroflexaceae bacterium]|nr:tetratricopeptide repeat protein [Chloroflexaceae bacterium]
MTSDSNTRVVLVQQHPTLADGVLAALLKDLCLEAWHSDPPRAVAAAAALVTLAEHSGLPDVLALAGWGWGIAALVEGRMDDALRHLDDAATRFLHLEQPHAAASVQVSRLIALAMLGRYDEAVTTGLQARDVFLAQGDNLAAGKIELNLGNIYDRRDRYAEAEQFYRTARQRFLMIDDQLHLIQSDNGLANVLSQQQQLHTAADLYSGALARAEALGLEVIQAQIEGNLGNLALDQGRYQQALDYLERSRRRYAALGMPHETALAERELADAYLELNLIPEAITIYERIEPTFEALEMPFEQAWTLAHHGRASLLHGKYDSARALLSRARALFVAEDNPVGEAMVMVLEAWRRYALGAAEEAATTAAAAEALFAAGGPLLWVLSVRWLRGEAARRAGDRMQARHLLLAALATAEAQAVPQVAQRCHTSLGLLAAAEGDHTTAAAAFQQAIELIEALRAPLPAEEFRTAFFADKLTPYAEMARLCLDDPTTDRTAEALLYVERARSRALTDLLGGMLKPVLHPRDSFEVALLEQLDELREELNWLYSQINRAFAGDMLRTTEALEQMQAAVRERETRTLEISRQLRQHSSTIAERVFDAEMELFDLPRLQDDLGDDTALLAYVVLMMNCWLLW